MTYIKENKKRALYISSLFAIWIISFILIITKKESSTLIVNDQLVSQPIITNEMSEIKGTERFDKAIKKVMKRWNVKGTSVAVMKDNKLIYAKGYGYADSEKEIACEPFNLFRIASMSKLITAIGIMKLVDDNHISLDSKVFGENGILKDEYKEYRDKRVENITIDHLLRHEGGFTTPIGDPMFKITLVEKGLDIKRPITSKNTIEYAISRRLGFRPGSSRRYSNVGYLILSLVIEKISKTSYEHYIKENVLIPAGCYNTHLANNLYNDKYENEVKYYSDTKGDFIKSYNGSNKIMPKCYGGNDVRALKGAGAWVSTTADMLRLSLSIDGKSGANDIEDILSAKSIYSMQYNNKKRYPIGWAKIEGRTYERTGSFSGTTTIMRLQAEGYSWIILSNTSSWIGYRLNNHFKSTMRSSLGLLPKVAPERNLFNKKYTEEILATTKESKTKKTE